MYLQSISGHSETASSQIPGSIDNYVTGVREGSQQCCGVKDAGD
ncbi:hypothetical protein HMPREF3197_03094 [Klebsiella pneumoniae]|nr:hypothetical protein HMPREF3197_03094 [Klebsiella pneumoniae]